MATLKADKLNMPYVELTPYPSKQMRVLRDAIHTARRTDHHWWKLYERNNDYYGGNVDHLLKAMAACCDECAYFGAAEAVWTSDSILSTEDGEELGNLLEQNFRWREERDVPKKASILLDPSECPHDGKWVPTDFSTSGNAEESTRIHGVKPDSELESRLQELTRNCLPLVQKAMSGPRFVEEFSSGAVDASASSSQTVNSQSDSQKYQVVFKARQLYFPADTNFRWVGSTMRFGEWHCEGTADDHIAACVFLPVLIENMRPDAKLDFRCPGDVSGFSREELLTLPSHTTRDVDLGSQQLEVGKPIVWKNDVQHRTDIYFKQDKTKAGRIVYLAMYIVDPAHRLPSTTEVPPQFRRGDMQIRKDTLLQADCLLQDLIPDIMTMCNEAWTPEQILAVKDEMKKARLHAWDRQNAEYDIRHLRIPRRRNGAPADTTDSESENDDDEEEEDLLAVPGFRF